MCLALTGATQWEQYQSVDTLIAAAMPQIFDFDYPFYNAAGKQDFQKQFLLNYFFHEICTTPVPRWKVMLRARLMEIMPKYIKLWESDQLKYDPLTNIDLYMTGGDKANETTDYTRDQDTTEKHDMERDESGGGAEHQETSGTAHETGKEGVGQKESGGGSQNGSTSGTKHSETEDSTTRTNTHNDHDSTTALRKYSDTPQSNIPWNDVTNLDYLTNVTQDTGTKTNNGGINEASTATGTQDGTESGTSESANNWDAKLDRETDSERDAQTAGKMDGNNNWDKKAAQGDTGSGTLDIKDNTAFEHTRNWDEHRGGMTGGVTYQNLVQQWRDLQIEYNREILHSLADCFFQIY